MTAAVERSTAEPRTFGNWQKPRSPGLVPRLGITGSVGCSSGCSWCC